MIVDIVLCVIIILITLLQYHRGILIGLRGLISFAGAGYLSFRYRDVVISAVAERASKPVNDPVMALISTAVLFAALAFIFYFLLSLVTNAIRSKKALRGIDKIFGGVFGLLEGVVLVLLAATLFGALDTCHLIHSEEFSAQIQASHLVSMTRGLASRVIIH